MKFLLEVALLVAACIFWIISASKNTKKDYYRIGKFNWATIYKKETPFLFYFIIYFNIFVALSLIGIVIAGIFYNPAAFYLK